MYVHNDWIAQRQIAHKYFHISPWHSQQLFTQFYVAFFSFSPIFYHGTLTIILAHADLKWTYWMIQYSMEIFLPTLENVNKIMLMQWTTVASGVNANASFQLIFWAPQVFYICIGGRSEQMPDNTAKGTKRDQAIYEIVLVPVFIFFIGECLHAACRKRENSHDWPLFYCNIGGWLTKLLVCSYMHTDTHSLKPHIRYNAKNSSPLLFIFLLLNFCIIILEFASPLSLFLFQTSWW